MAKHRSYLVSPELILDASLNSRSIYVRFEHTKTRFVKNFGGLSMQIVFCLTLIAVVINIVVSVINLIVIGIGPIFFVLSFLVFAFRFSDRESRFV